MHHLPHVPIVLHPAAHNGEGLNLCQIQMRRYDSRWRNGRVCLQLAVIAAHKHSPILSIVILKSALKYCELQCDECNVHSDSKYL